MTLPKMKIALAGAVIGIVAALTGPANAQEFTLKLHHFLPPVAMSHKTMLVPWADKVMKESGGRIKIEVYPAMQLGGKPPQLIDQVRDGIVDIVWTLPGYTPGRFTRTEVFELPFMHRDTASSNKALTEFLETNGDEFSDYHVIAMFVHAGQLFHSIKPIRVAADLEGQKIRTPTRTGGWMIEAMGATPIGAPVPKIPELLSKGVVDSVMIPFEVTLPLKVNELVDYHTILGGDVERINTTTFIIAMNKDSYAKLPDDLKKVFDDNSGAALSDWLAEIWDAAELPGIAKAKESGEIITMSEAEVAKLRANVEQPVIDHWVGEMKAKGVDGQALVVEARALIAKYRK
ncbi:MAG: TRAP transporter substrate-binding protein [Alphaproteobacteria bacterium]|nr:TRAP transporter substrate-binding protein [Alphaproteobacteria bacterium]